MRDSPSLHRKMVAAVMAPRSRPSRVELAAKSLVSAHGELVGSVRHA